jgi:hypothetical protein
LTESVPPLDPGLLGPLREAEPAPAAIRARARERLLTAVAGLGGSGGPGSGGDRGGPGGRARLPGASGIAAIAFVLGGLAGAGLYAALAPVPATRVVYVDRVAPPAPVAPGATVATTATSQLAPAASAAMPPPSAAPLTHASQLSAERILLDEARAALAQGDPARAIDRLERHRRTFPAPLLAEERDAMWIQALVKAGRYDEARARATAFQKRSPDSLFSSVVASAIDSIP